MDTRTEDDVALTPAELIAPPGAEFADTERRWQGIPGIERAPGGRLWAAWYSGGDGEGPGNCVVVATSADDGRSWSSPALVVRHPHPEARAYDPALWLDPAGRLWLFWAQSRYFFDGRAGVWAVCTDHPDSAAPAWSAPRRLANGVMMNKPTALTSGEWLMPAAVWICTPHNRPELAAEQFSNVYASEDQGQTWVRRGGADVPDRRYDEHMVVELTDGRLWMLVRTIYGIGQSFSADRGRTWTPGEPSAIPGPNSRFFIRRLRSGRLLLVNHYRFTKRSHLTARLSEDDGRSWGDGLLMDERAGVSYPDAVEAPDGRIFAIYDHNRGDRYAIGDDKEILLATFREEDVLAGRPITGDCRLRQLVNRALAPNPSVLRRNP